MFWVSSIYVYTCNDLQIFRGIWKDICCVNTHDITVCNIKFTFALHKKMNCQYTETYITRFSLIKNWLNVITTYLGNYIRCELSDGSINPPQSSTVQPLNLGNGEVISSHYVLCMWLFMHSGIKMIIIWIAWQFDIKKWTQCWSITNMYVRIASII